MLYFRGVNRMLLRVDDCVVFSSLKEFLDQRVLSDAWPHLHVKVAVHQELTEAQKRQRNVPTNPPTLLLIEDWCETRKIPVRRVLVVDSWNLNGEVPPHFLYER